MAKPPFIDGMESASGIDQPIEQREPLSGRARPGPSKSVQRLEGSVAEGPMDRAPLRVTMTMRPNVKGRYRFFLAKGDAGAHVSVIQADARVVPARSSFRGPDYPRWTASGSHERGAPHQKAFSAPS